MTKKIIYETEEDFSGAEVGGGEGAPIAWPTARHILERVGRQVAEDGYVPQQDYRHHGASYLFPGDAVITWTVSVSVEFDEPTDSS